MGQLPAGSVLLVSTPGDVDRLEVCNPGKLAYVTQTTLSVNDTADVVAALKKRFPHIQGPKRDDICYATTNRQMAVQQLARHCEVVLVIGSRNSSNSNRLREVAEREGARAWLVDDADDVHPDWFTGARCVGITAGASAPEALVQGVVDCLKRLGAESVETLHTVEERVTFSLPDALR